MATTALRRQPDAGVNDALKSVASNVKFKRMMVFGLKSLSDFCVPPTIKYKENSACVLTSDQFPSLLETPKNFKGDDEVLTLLGKIYWGVTEAALEDPRLAETLQTLNFTKAVEDVIAGGIQDEKGLELYLGTVKNLNTLKVPVQRSVIAAGLINTLNVRQKTPQISAIVNVVESCTQDEAAVTELVKADGANKILSVLGKKTDIPSSTAVAALNVCKAIYKQKQATAEDLDRVIEIIDRYRDERVVQNAGSAALSSMVSINDLKNCLSILQRSSGDSPEKTQALTTLSSMSYISSFADEVVKTGGISLLVEAVQQAAKTSIKGLIGAAKMLQAVAANQSEKQKISDAGGLQALCEAAGVVSSKSPQALAAIMGALEPLVSIEENATKAAKSNILQVCIEAIRSHPKDQFVILACTRLLSAMAEKDGTLDPMKRAGVLQVVSTSCQCAGPAAGPLASHSLKIAARLATVSDPNDIVTASNGLCECFLTQVSDVDVANSGCDFLTAAARVGDVPKRLAGSKAVDSVLSVMLEHIDTAPQLASRARDIIDTLATEQDVNRTLNELETAINGARSNPVRCLRCLAAVNGLSQVSRMAPMFEKKDASKIIVVGLGKWIDGAKFDAMQKSIRASCQCVEALVSCGSTDVDNILERLIGVIQQPGLKSLRASQDDVANNSLVDLCCLLEAVAATQRFGNAEQVGHHVDGILRVMRKYPDARIAQVSCINALNSLASWSTETESGAQKIVDAGALRSVLAYMNKVGMYEEVQVAGCRLMLTLAQTNEKTADYVKNTDALTIVTKACRTHRKSARLNKYGTALLGLLIPENELEKLIQENIREINRCVKIGDMGGVAAAIKAINTSCNSAEASRIAARCDLGRAIKAAVDAAGAAPNDPSSLAVMSEAAIAGANLTQKHFGVTNLQKNGGVETLVKIFEALNKVPGAEGQREVLTTMKRLLKKNKNDSEILYQKGFVTKICRYAEQVRDTEPDLFTEAVGVMAAMKQTEALSKNEDFRRFIGNVCEKMGQDTGPPLNANLAESMDSLLVNAGDEILDLFVKKGGLEAVYKMMDDYPADGRLVRHCQNIVDTIAKKQNLRERIKRMEGPAPLERVTRVTKKVLRVRDIDADTAAISLSNLNRIVTPKDADMLSEADLIPEIERLMQDYPDHQPLIKAAGEYLGKVGCDDQVRNLMKKIIDCCEAKAPGWEKELEKLNNKLAVYLVGQVNNPDKALKLTEPCMNALAAAATKLKNHPPALTSIAKVSRRIARRSRDDPSTPYGVPALKTSMMKTLAELLASDCDKPDVRPRAFVIDGFHCLADCARHPDANSLAVEQGLTMGTIKHADAILKNYEHDPEVCAAILDYLAAVCSKPKTADKVVEALAKARPNSRRIGEPQIVDDIVAMMKRFRNNPALMEAALDALASMGQNGKAVPTILADANSVSDLFALGEENPKTLANIIRANRRVVGKVPPETSTLALKKAQDAYKGIQNDPSVSDADKALVAAEIAQFIEAMADNGLIDAVKKLNGPETLVELLEDNAGTMTAVTPINRAMRRCAEKDADMNAKLARTALPVLLGLEAACLAGGFENTKETLTLLDTLAGPEGQGRLLGNAAGLAPLMAAVHETAHELPMHEALELEALEKSMKQKIAEDQPESLTLELVYNKWNAAKSGGEALIVEDNSLVIRYFDFVANYTEEYAKEKLDKPDSGLGAEFVYGCLCYRLLHEHEENTRAVMEKNDEPKIFFHGMGTQKNDVICQNAVQAALSCLEWPETADAWANSPNAAAIAADVLNRGRKMKVDEGQKETYVIERLKLCEKISVSRTYFNGTECMAALIGLWDDYDASKYSVAVLKGVFQSMRRIVNDHWVGIILQNKVPKRLIEVINNVNANIEVLPDVLFLLAALAVVPEIKGMIGELKGVEACLGLLVRAFKDTRPMSAVLTNTCLALSAITMGHTANLTRFVQNKGIELNIPAMDQQNKPSLDYDVANAASVLMCNNCFKRDELKELYGNKGACQAVMRTIHKYDGKEDQKAFRCLGAMFKAIGNLALYTPNVQIFMAANIEQTFAHLYQKSDRLPDQLVEGTLRTLSNLSMENTQENMRRFGVCMSPILYMLRQGQRTSVKMFTLAFDVLGLLCRLPANSKKFLEEGGVPICLRILNQYQDSYLYSNGIRVLGIQTTTPAAVGELIQHGVFDFLSSLLENQVTAIQQEEADHDLAVSGLRCIRRLLTSKHEAKRFIEAGGLQQCIALMSACPSEISMTHLEAQRVICNLLALFPPPQPTAQQRAARVVADDDWDEDVADEGVRTGVELLDRPDGPRSWQSIDLDTPQICTIIESLCVVLSRSENLKQTRLARCAMGLLAYFACEKIPGTVGSFYNGNIGEILERVFETVEDSDLIKVGCYIINNVAYASEPEDYIQLRKCRTMRKNLDVASGKLSGEPKTFCEMTLKLLNEKSADPTRFEIHQQWNFPLQLTWWDKDKYPMGVQDLPPEWKEELRAGGKFKTIVNGRDREVIWWKSSMDLTQLQWRVDPKEGAMQHSLGVSRICSIAKGLKSETLILANQQGSPTSKPRDGDSLVLRGLPCEEFPEGVELNIICMMKRQRDKFFDLLVEWREAAAFGF